MNRTIFYILIFFSHFAIASEKGAGDIPHPDSRTKEFNLVAFVMRQLWMTIAQESFIDAKKSRKITDETYQEYCTHVRMINNQMYPLSLKHKKKIIEKLDCISCRNSIKKEVFDMIMEEKNIHSASIEYIKQQLPYLS